MHTYTWLVLGATQISGMEIRLGSSFSALPHTLCVLSRTNPAASWLQCLHRGATAGDVVGTLQIGHDMANASSGAVRTEEKLPILV